MPVIVAPSLLSADFLHLQAEVESIKATGAEWLHIDVMDGRFVPPISFGAAVMKAVRPVWSGELDVHLMVQEPERQLEFFQESGANRVTVHQEVTPHLVRLLQDIRSRGLKTGIALNPGTSVESIFDSLEYADLVLIMTVNPGWGGQQFLRTTLRKVAQLDSIRKEERLNFQIQVDGGINGETAKLCRDCGASIFVAGSAIFGSSDRAAAVAAIRGATP